MIGILRVLPVCTSVSASDSSSSVPNPPGMHHVGGGEFDEHDLAREKMLESLGDILVADCRLLVRQLDVEADAGRFAEKGAPVGRLHDARAAAGNHRKAGVGEQARDFLGEQVIG